MGISGNLRFNGGLMRDRVATSHDGSDLFTSANIRDNGWTTTR
jgi:hypothetical protein